MIYSNYGSDVMGERKKRSINSLAIFSDAGNLDPRVTTSLGPEMKAIRMSGTLSWLFYFVILLCAPMNALAEAPTKPHFVAVVDAGSSGSRIYLYDVRRREHSSEIKDLMQYESEAPGLSSFKGKPAEAGVNGLGPLIQRLGEFLSEKNISKTDVAVDVLATGGMRLLEEADQQAIFDSVKKYINERALTLDRLETIPGKMEGVYSWVDVNYLLGKLSDKQPTVGVVEIGGASAQIAFETSAANENDATVTIRGKSYNVFAHSFLGLGRNEARKGMIEIPEGASGTVKNPCYPRGLTFDDPKAGAKGLTGNFLYPACIRLYETVIDKIGVQTFQNLVKDGPNAFAAVGTGNPVGTFWGLLEAWKLATANPFEISEQAEANCGRPWSEIETEFGSAPFNKTQCADSVFVSTFLYGGAGLGLKRGSVTSYKSIHDKTPTWTRGFVVVEYLK